MRQEADRRTRGQPDLAMAPGPEAGHHLEQADGDGRVAGDQHPLAAVDGGIQAFDQHLAVRVGDAQIMQHQLGLI